VALNEQYEAITWPETHYVYIEKVGPFQETAPQAWQGLHALKEELSKHNQITGAFSQYKVESQIYRAGFSIVEAPKDLPKGLEYTLFEGGSYSRFVLTGSYYQLPQACGRVFEIVRANSLQAPGRFCLEHYANDPSSTPEDQLITEILIPSN
jgi:DNA gyrase inhibitor GyrI